MPPSTNRLWRHGGGHVYRSKLYLEWIAATDMAAMAGKQLHQGRITGPFTFELMLNVDDISRSDGDNRIKAALDWCQRCRVILNDKDCREGRWRWVAPHCAPAGCRIILRSWHGA